MGWGGRQSVCFRQNSGIIGEKRKVKSKGGIKRKKNAETKCMRKKGGGEGRKKNSKKGSWGNIKKGLVIGEEKKNTKLKEQEGRRKKRTDQIYGKASHPQREEGGRGGGGKQCTEGKKRFVKGFGQRRTMEGSSKGARKNEKGIIEDRKGGQKKAAGVFQGEFRVKRGGEGRGLSKGKKKFKNCEQRGSK